MRAKELKRALALAQSEADLSGFDDSPLFGCALSDYKGCTVPLGAIAKLLRWQCQCLDGSWDWREYHECTGPALRKRCVMVAEESAADLQRYLAETLGERLSK